MAGATGAATRKKAVAARAEKNGKVREFDFEGIKIPTPTKLPGTLSWDIAEIQSASDSENPNLGPIRNLLVSLIGEEHVRRCRNRIAEKGLDEEAGTKAFADLLDKIIQEAGTSLGNSPASPKS